MKKIAIVTLVGLLGLAAPAALSAETTSEVPSFPGAEGYGRLTTGGRGGKVYHVTNLNDSGEGSLRAAVEASGTRTVVFDVSGTIYLKSELKLRNGNITIAGQTAPGDGICVGDYPFMISADNVIIRFMRFRIGSNNAQDATDSWDGLGCLDQRNIMIDHCSVSWSFDECLSLSGTHNTTVQWCIVSQSLVNVGHSKGNHGYGGNWGGEYGSYHHNLLAHHTSRAPRLGPRPSTQLNEVMDMRNNVMYNYYGEGCYGGEGMNINMVNNYYKPGPGGNTSTKGKRIAKIGIRNNQYVTTYPAYAPALHKIGTYYIDGNMNSAHSDVLADNWNTGVYNQIATGDWDGLYNAQVKEDMRLDTPIDYTYTTTHTPDQAFEKVLAYAGASLSRDALDAMIVDEAKNNTAASTGSGQRKGFINTQYDIVYPAGTSDASTGFPLLKEETTTQKDSDGDGMPDDWEIANGLDPNDVSDGNKIGKDGYTNLEIYLNSLVADIMEAGNEGGKLLTGNLEYSDPAVELPEYVAPVNETWTICASTNISATTKPADWKFNNGVSITCDNATRAYSASSSSTKEYLKYSNNETYTIHVPDGYVINSILVSGRSNVANASGIEMNGTTYTLPEKTLDPVEFTVNYSDAPTEASFKVVNGQSILLITLNVSKGQSGIDDIIVDQDAPKGDGKTYNMMGVEVRGENLAPGIYIRDGKKFIVR